MNKWLIILFCVILSPVSFSQKKTNKVKETWYNIRESHGFERSTKYQGPTEAPNTSPSSINENQTNPQGYSNSQQQPYQGIPLTDKEIEEGRRFKKGANGNGGNGTISSDPNIAPAEKVEVPEIDGPDVQFKSNDSMNSGKFWYYLGILFLLLVVAFIIYQIVKNYKGGGGEKHIPFEALGEDLNPSTISKTELELRLEEALSKEDYKECVRIYFLFAIKDLIEKRWIFWKREKTNMHYIIEIQGKPAAYDFEQIVSIYDLVWYGDYTLNKSGYEGMQATLERCYKNIEAQK